MKSFIIAMTAAAVAVPTLAPAPALAASRHEKHHDRKHERKHERKVVRKVVHKQIRRNHRQAQRDWRHYRNYDWNRREAGQSRYYADRYYRSGNYYADRRLAYNDRIYRGSNGNYYCRRSDGTTGLIIGAGIGALIGNQLHIGGSRTLSTLIGGAAGGLLGREISRGQLRCN